MFNKWLKENDLTTIDFNSRLFNKASDREYWESILCDNQIKVAEKYLGFEWPLIRASQFMNFQKNGDRLSQEKPHFARRYALLYLFLGELAEHKGRFIPDIVDGIFAICEESYWGLSAHYPLTRLGELLPTASDPYIDLFAAETAELISVIYHVMYDELFAYCPPIVERIEYELERRIVTPYINRGDFWWMGNTPKKLNNWTPWILANVATVFVCLNVKKTQFYYAVKKMFVEMNRYYDILPDDGGCDEGASYWTKAGGKLFEFLDVIYITSGGKIDLFADKKLKEIALYETRVHIDGCNFVNFADGVSAINNSNLDYALYGFGIRSNLPEMCALAKTLKTAQNRDDSQPALRGSAVKANLFSLIYAKDIDAQKDFKPQSSYFLNDLQNAFLRQGDWFLAAKGGHNKEHHNHNDVGSFIAYFNGNPVLVDPGAGTYTKKTFSPRRYEIPSMQSAYHNLPVINGVCQQVGEQFKADSFKADKTSISISFASAYPEQAGALKVERSLNISPDGIELNDCFETNGGDVYEHFMTPLDVTVEDDGVVLGNKYKLLCNAISTEVDRFDFEGDMKFINAWGYEGLNRIKFKVDNNVKMRLTKI